MKKEERIDMILSFLSPIIYKDIISENNSYPHVIFLSSTEVQTMESEECIPTNKVYTQNTLMELLQKVINIYYKNEENNWLEWWSTRNPEISTSNIENIYDSNFYPEHPYHKLRILKEFIDE